MIKNNMYDEQIKGVIKCLLIFFSLYQNKDIMYNLFFYHEARQQDNFEVTYGALVRVSDRVSMHKGEGHILVILYTVMYIFILSKDSLP